MASIKISSASKHALDMLMALSDGAYFVMVVDDEVMKGPFVSPPRGAAFMLDDRWVVFSPVEHAN